MDYKKIQKFFFSRKEYKLIKKMNKQRNQVSYQATVDDFTILEGGNRIGRAFISGSKIGYKTYIGSGIFEKCKIGKFCSISDNVRVIASTHPICFLSTHPFFYDRDNGKFNEFLTTEEGYFCEIGNDVWIGTNVLIKGGIRIGDGVIIGMGSVVTKDVPPYAIIAGNPARILRFRFPDETICKVLLSGIWNKDCEYYEINKEAFYPNGEISKEYIKK